MVATLNPRPTSFTLGKDPTMVNGGSESVNRERAVLTDILSDRVIAFHPRLARVLGGIPEAIFLQQLMFWSRQSSDGWVNRTQEQLEDETTLSSDVQQRVRESLVARGVILEERRRGNRLWYRPNVELIIGLLSGSKGVSGSPSPSPLDGPPSPTPPTPPKSPQPAPTPASPKKSSSRRVSERARVPEDWHPTERTVEIVLGYKHIVPDDIETELRRFKNYHQAKGSVFADFDAAFRTWMGNQSDWREEELAKKRPAHGVMPQLRLVDGTFVSENAGRPVSSEAAMIQRRRGINGGSN